jgi:hypothetical protein
VTRTGLPRLLCILLISSHCILWAGPVHVREEASAVYLTNGEVLCLRVGTSRHCLGEDTSVISRRETTLRVLVNGNEAASLPFPYAESDSIGIRAGITGTWRERFIDIDPRPASYRLEHHHSRAPETLLAPACDLRFHPARIPRLKAGRRPPSGKNRQRWTNCFIFPAPRLRKKPADSTAETQFYSVGEIHCLLEKSHGTHAAK